MNITCDSFHVKKIVFIEIFVHIVIAHLDKMIFVVRPKAPVWRHLSNWLIIIFFRRTNATISRLCSAIWALVPFAYLPVFLLWKYEGGRARTFWEKSEKCYLSYSCLLFGHLSFREADFKMAVKAAGGHTFEQVNKNMFPALPPHHKMDIIRYQTDLWPRGYHLCK